MADGESVANVKVVVEAASNIVVRTGVVGPPGPEGPEGPAGPPGQDLPPGVTVPIVVNHGDDPEFPRPDAEMVIWRGTVEPIEWTIEDIWHDISI